MATDISFIIPVHNTSSLLERCFNSIFANKTDFIYELVVVDDASTDDSLQRIQEIELKKPQNCKMEIIHLSENIGPRPLRPEVVRCPLRGQSRLLCSRSSHAE